MSQFLHNDKAIDIDIILGRRLKFQRDIKGLSQEVLGARVGVSRIKIGHYEAGKSSVPSSVLHKLARVFDVEVSYFFQGLEEIQEDVIGNLAKEELSRETMNLLKSIESMDSPEVRKRFAAVVERTAHLLAQHKKTSS